MPTRFNITFGNSLIPRLGISNRFYRFFVKFFNEKLLFCNFFFSKYYTIIHENLKIFEIFYSNDLTKNG